MKQRVRVVAIVQEARGVLAMKRAKGRLDAAPVWELPTGKIRFGEQPEEAMGRMMEEYLGISSLENVQLSDVITFMAPSGASQISNLYIVYQVRLKEGAKIEPRERYSAYKYMKAGDLDACCFDEASLMALEIEQRDGVGEVMKEVSHGATVYIDGCSRGNPGPAGVGYVVLGEDGALLAQGGEFIGFATARVAEYYALKKGVEEALRLGLRRVRFMCDSLMVVNQMKGIYKVKNNDVMGIFDDIRELLTGIEAYTFTHIAREQNQRADAEANAAVDRKFGE